MDRLDRQFDFLRETDKLKQIGRQSYLADGSRKENDAEHSWHLALMAVLLSGYAEKDIDVLRVMTMVLVHDIVEIDAGDTTVFLCKPLPHLYSYLLKMNEIIYTGYSICAFWYTKTR